MNEAEQENLFQEIVESILNQEEFKMDTCFDASTVEDFLEKQSICKHFSTLDKEIEVGKEQICGRGLASYIKIKSDQEFKKFILWPSTTDNSGRNGLKAYDCDDIENASEIEIANDDISDLIFELTEFIAS